MSEADMTTKDTGGWAFPSHGSMGEVAWEGMTLRDYFAAQVIGPLACSSLRQENTTAEDASLAYHIADAMLKARQP